MLAMLMTKNTEVVPVDRSNLKLFINNPTQLSATMDGFGLGYDFTFSVDGGEYQDIANGMTIEEGEHTIDFKFNRTTGDLMVAMSPFYESLIEVLEWDNFNLEHLCFAGVSSLQRVPTVLPQSLTSLYAMFSGVPAIQSDVTGWDTSKITDMVALFGGTTEFNQDISGWDVSKVTKFMGMFYECVNFNQDLSTWDMGSAEMVDAMFDGCTTFNQDLSGWNVSNVVSHESFSNNTPNWQEDFKPVFPS